MEQLFIKGGKLLDPASGFKGEKKDILIEDGLFTQIGEDIQPGAAAKVVTLDGEYVAPGFIDAHVHVYRGVSLGVTADDIGVKQGVTSVIDAGSAGPLNLKDFIENDIKKNQTRVFSAMHFAKIGLLSPPEADAEDKYDLDLAREVYKEYQEYIVGIKARASKSCVGDLGITSIKAGKELASSLHLPIMVHIGNMPPTIEEVLDIMEDGDVITHALHGKQNNLFTDGQLKPQTKRALERGVLFDVGHGKESFNFKTAALAKSLGFDPQIVSTDLHSKNVNGPVFSLSITLDKMLALGYDLEWCVDRVTRAPAEAYHLTGLGKIAPGYKADLTIFKLKDGEYQFTDSNNNQITGHQSIDVVHTVLGGGLVMSR